MFELSGSRSRGKCNKDTYCSKGTINEWLQGRKCSCDTCMGSYIYKKSKE